MFAAELVDFVMNLVENPNFVIIDSVVLDGLLSKVLPQSIDDFDLLKHHIHTTTSTTGHIIHLVSL